MMTNEQMEQWLQDNGYHIYKEYYDGAIVLSVDSPTREFCISAGVIENCGEVYPTRYDEVIALAYKKANTYDYTSNAEAV